MLSKLFARNSPNSQSLHSLPASIKVSSNRILYSWRPCRVRCWSDFTGPLTQSLCILACKSKVRRRFALSRTCETWRIKRKLVQGRNSSNSILHGAFQTSATVKILWVLISVLDPLLDFLNMTFWISHYTLCILRSHTICPHRWSRYFPSALPEAWMLYSTQPITHKTTRIQ